MLGKSLIYRFSSTRFINAILHKNSCYASADPEGGTGSPDPPGKSQVIWVSIENKQLDPPGKSWTPLEKC